MKTRNLNFAAAFALAASMLASCAGVTNTEKTADASEAAAAAEEISISKPVDVYYFHLTRRCFTCNKIEEVAGNAVKDLFPAAMADGMLKFHSINVEATEHKELAEKYQASGAALIVSTDEYSADLTDKAFLMATSRPDRLKAEILAIVKSSQE
jgi:hypothetical protein